MTTARAQIAGLVLALLWGFSQASADPRWWTDDLQLTFGPEPKDRPHVTSLEGNGGYGIFVGWEQLTAAGDRDVYLLASFDGCNWCGPVRWASGPADETRPWLGVGTTHTLEIAIQVVFERNGQVWVASDFSIPFTPNPSAMCASFAALAEPTPRLLSQDLLAVDSHPRIFVVGRWAAFSQFHAVWQSERAGFGSSIHYDHDLNQDGTGWGTEFLDLTALLGEQGSQPAVTGDLMSTVQSAVTVAYLGPTGEIRMVRSGDAGRTWPGPATTVSGAPARVHPSVDTDTMHFNFGQPAWNGFAWQPTSAPHQVTFDAAHFVMPFASLPDFEPTPTDHPVGNPLAPTQLEASVSVWPGTIGISGVYLFWTDEPPTRPTEVVARAGVLDDIRIPPRDLDRYPFAPDRVAPPDPVVSPVHPLSNCIWDDGWPALSMSTCATAPRSLGTGASLVTSRDAASYPLDGFMATFLDDRTGTPQVYFKITDRWVGTPSFDATTTPTYTCSAPGELSATVAFGLLPECPATSSFAPSERMSRYLIYTGRSATGPFTDRVALESAGLTDPAFAVVPRLAPGTSYTLTLIAEDEARNIQPPSFDPRSSTNVGLSSAQQLLVTTPSATCLPSVTVGCAIVAESCADGRPANGVYEPGEDVVIELTFTNGGDLAADGFAATVTASNADVGSPAISFTTIAANGGVQTVRTTVRIDAAIPCNAGANVDIDLDAMRTQWGPLTPTSDELITCDFVTARPGEACTPCASCAASGILPIRPIYATKSSPTRVDVLLDWATAADPIAESYNTWRVSGASNKFDIANAREGGSWPNVVGCRRTAPTNCTDIAAVPGTGGDLYFYQVRGVCGTTEAAE